MIKISLICFTLKEKKMDLLTLIEEKKQLEETLNNLIFGSIEIREKSNKKYIYLHKREDGLSITKFIGEYSKELHNLILENNIKAKELRKKLKTVTKELKSQGYVDKELSKVVSLNIDFARRHMAETIYKQAVLEGIATTFADTETIIEGGKVNNMTAEDVLKVVNLKHAWEFVMNKNVLFSLTNFALLSEINKLILEGFYYNAGKVRSTPVRIGGTNWKPELPFETVIKEELNKILNKKISIIDKSIELILFVIKKQIFIDGNKRTAIIFANHLLIKNGKGLIVIPNEQVEKFKSLLIAYYEGKGVKKIKDFLKNYCFIKL